MLSLISLTFRRKVQTSNWHSFGISELGPQIICWKLREVRRREQKCTEKKSKKENRRILNKQCRTYRQNLLNFVNIRMFQYKYILVNKLYKDIFRLRWFCSLQIYVSCFAWGFDKEKILCPCCIFSLSTASQFQRRGMWKSSSYRECQKQGKLKNLMTSCLYNFLLGVNVS